MHGQGHYTSKYSNNIRLEIYIDHLFSSWTAAAFAVFMIAPGQQHCVPLLWMQTHFSQWCIHLLNARWKPELIIFQSLDIMVMWSSLFRDSLVCDPLAPEIAWCQYHGGATSHCVRQVFPWIIWWNFEHNFSTYFTHFFCVSSLIAEKYPCIMGCDMCRLEYTNWLRGWSNYGLWYLWLTCVGCLMVVMWSLTCLILFPLQWFCFASLSVTTLLGIFSLGMHSQVSLYRYWALLSDLTYRKRQEGERTRIRIKTVHGPDGSRTSHFMHGTELWKTQQ